MSFDNKDRQELSKILKNQKWLIDNIQEIRVTLDDKPADPFKHLDALAEKVRYDMANHEKYFKNSLKLDKIHQNAVVLSLSHTLNYINEIKEAEG